MRTLIDGYDDKPSVGDRVVISDSSQIYVGEPGLIVGQDVAMSNLYGSQVFILMLDVGLRIRAYASCLIKSPYQNEKLEEVPSV